MKKNSFMQGAIIATIAIIFSKVIGVLYVIPFYSIIDDKGGALYGYAYSIYNIFLIISSAGIPLAISKITSEYETKKEYKNKMIMYDLSKKIIYIFSIISFLICFVFAKPIAHLILGSLTEGNTIEDVAFVIRCISFALLIVPILSSSRGYLQGHKYITPSSLSQVIEQIVRILVILIGSYICVKVLHISVTYAVGISVFSACIGAIIAYIYLHYKMKQIFPKEDMQKVIATEEEKKAIISKLIGYCIPFIVINIANSIYNTTDMILINRGLKLLNFTDLDIETISSVYTTWGSKIISIVTAFATGLVISLIPSIVEAYTLKNQKNVDMYFNKMLLVLLHIILPLTIFMSIFAQNIWSVFYRQSVYGPIILKYTILVAFFDSAYIMICSALQGLYKTKLIYISVTTGLFINSFLDIPFMLLFNKLGLYPFYGATTATVIGYIISLSIPLLYLSKKEKFNYKETFKTLPRLIIAIIFLCIICLLYQHFISFKSSQIYNIIYLVIIGIICLIIYYGINKKILNHILSDKLEKIHLKKS